MAEKRNLQIVIDAKNEASPKLKKIDNDLNGLTKSLGLGTIGIAAFVGGIGFLGKSMIMAAGEFEQTKIAFTTMLGDAAKANTLLRDLADFAARTPFTLTGIEQSAKQLLAMGIESDKLIPTLKALGDVSAGVSIDLGRVAYNYGQVKTQTKLTGVELKDFMRAGIPLLSELAKNLGESESEIKGMVSAGKIGFPEVEAAFKSMSDEGGKFFNLMDKQSQTMLGRVSNLQDGWEQFLRKQGAGLIIFAGIFVDKLAQIVEWLNKDAEGANWFGKTIFGLIKFTSALGKTFMGVAKILAAFIALGIESFIELGKTVWNFGKDVINAFRNIKDIGGSVFKAIGMAITGNFVGAADEIKKKFSETFSASINNAQDFKERTNAHMVEIGDALYDIENSWGDFIGLKGFEGAKEKFGILGETLSQDLGGGLADADAKTKELQDSMGKLSKEIEETTSESIDAFQKVTEKISDLRDELQGANKKREDDEIALREKYAQNYIDQEEKIAATAKELKDKQAEYVVAFNEKVDGDNLVSHNETLRQLQAEKKELEDSLAAEKTAIESKGNFEKKFAAELEEIKRRNNLTEFERVNEDLSHKQFAIWQEFDEKKEEIEKELKLELGKLAAMEKINAEMLKMVDKLNAQRETLTIDSINKEIEAWNELAKAIARAKEGKTSSTIGISSLTSERASQTIGSVNVNITGNNISSEEDARSLAKVVGDEIMKTLSFNTKLTV